MNRALEGVWNHIGAVRSDLPSDVGFTVEQMTPSINPIMAIALTGGDDPAHLREYAFYQLAPPSRPSPTSTASRCPAATCARSR